MDSKWGCLPSQMDLRDGWQESNLLSQICTRAVNGSEGDDDEATLS